VRSEGPTEARSCSGDPSSLQKGPHLQAERRPSVALQNLRGNLQAQQRPSVARLQHVYQDEVPLGLEEGVVMTRALAA
jgi:hypothetical protein